MGVKYVGPCGENGAPSACGTSPKGGGGMSDPIFIRLCRKCASATSLQRGRPRGYMLLEEPESAGDAPTGVRAHLRGFAGTLLLIK